MSNDLKERQHLFNELEQAITVANREYIHKTIGDVTKDDFMKLAVMVARFRSNYLQEALRLSGAYDDSTPEEAHIAELKRRRESYEEALKAFEALKHAADRKYFDLKAG